MTAKRKADQVECERCGSTVSASQLRVATPVEDRQAGDVLMRVIRIIDRRRQTADMNQKTDIAYELTRLRETIDAELTGNPLAAAALRKADATPSQTPATATAWSRERATLHKMIAGMAAEHYQYDPNAPRSDVPNQITADLERHGIAIDADTARKHLKAASDQTARR